jgi:hypothetical protein
VFFFPQFCDEVSQSGNEFTGRFSQIWSQAKILKKLFKKKIYTFG